MVVRALPTQGNELLEKEMARAAAGEAMQAMDTFRYNLEPPQPSKRNDVAAWRAALDNAYAQLEHQYNRCCCPAMPTCVVGHRCVCVNVCWPELCTFGWCCWVRLFHSWAGERLP
jgi:hypothetical protein